MRHVALKLTTTLTSIFVTLASKESTEGIPHLLAIARVERRVKVERAGPLKVETKKKRE